VVGYLSVEVLAPSVSGDAEPVEHESDQALERRVVQVVEQSPDIAPDKRERFGHFCSQACALAHAP